MAKKDCSNNKEWSIQILLRQIVTYLDVKMTLYVLCHRQIALMLAFCVFVYIDGGLGEG